GGRVERLQAPIIEDEKICAAEMTQQTRMSAVAARQREIFEQPGHALIENRAIVATGLVAKRRGKPTFSDAGRTDQGQIVMGVDPIPFGELLEQGAVETAGITIIDVFDAGLLAQFGVA